jgi:hypothetical protein
MDVEQFWKMIEATRPSNRDLPSHCDNLIDLLSRDSVDEVVSFACILCDLMDDAYRWDLWTVAYVVCGGYLSDDSFKDFRGWLIMQGKEFFQASLKSPLVIPDRIPDSAEPFCEEIQGVAEEAYCLTLGDDSDFPYPEPYPFVWELRQLKGQPIDLQHPPREYTELMERFIKNRER